ncbi:hypothetical protein ACG7TL_003472 [Trametes sanguinea]
MVFARLTPQDKDAFFALLDELSTVPFPSTSPSTQQSLCACPPMYFESRPEIFGNSSGSGTSGGNGTSAATRAAAASVVSSAFAQSNRNSTVPSITNGWKKPDAAATAEISNSVGRVAAAAAALRANGGGEQSPAPAPGSAGGFPRPPPRRGASSNSTEEPAAPPPEHNKLVPTRKFGDVDMSSTKNMFSSIRHSTAAKHAPPPQVAPPTPPAFPRKNTFAPPPRRVPSASGSAASANSPPPPAPPRRQQEPEQEEEEEGESGEWAEALYDYHSEDPGDLDLQEGVRVLIVEKTSDDWWTGELNGQRGLVPAAYVKLL